MERGKGIILRSETNICFWNGAAHPQGLKASRRRGAKWGGDVPKEEKHLVPKAKLDFLAWMGMASVRELEEVTVPHQSWVCPVPLWVFPPITRDAKLRGAHPLSAPW